MGFYSALGKKNFLKTSVSSKLQITESEKFLGVFFPGDYHFCKSKVRPGRYLVSDLTKRSEKTLLHIYKTISSTEAVELFSDNKHCSITYQLNPTS